MRSVCLLKSPPKAGQAVYTFVTLLLPIFVLYESKFWSSVYIILLFAISVWNVRPSLVPIWYSRLLKAVHF